MDALAGAERAGAGKVRVVDRDTGTVYVASINAIRQLGFDVDRGFGKQLALPLEHWRIVDRKAYQPSLLPELAA